MSVEVPAAKVEALAQAVWPELFDRVVYAEASRDYARLKVRMVLAASAAWDREFDVWHRARDAAASGAAS